MTMAVAAPPARTTPVHLWIVGALALVWNAFGAFDYVATQLRLESYMSAFTPEQLDYFYGFPAWHVAAWATAVWSAVAGSVALLLRSRWAVGLFGLSLAAMALSSVYTLGLTEGLKLMGEGALVMTAAIWIAAIGLFLYARAMARRGVLR